MSIAEEKADAYLRASHDDYEEWRIDGGWSDAAVKAAYEAGYVAAERYRLILQAAIRNATPQPPTDA